MNPQNIKNHRVLSLIYAIMMFSAFVLMILGVTEVWADAKLAYLPMITLCFFIQAYINWATSRRLAVIHLLIAIFGIATCVLMFFI